MNALQIFKCGFFFIMQAVQCFRLEAPVVIMDKELEMLGKFSGILCARLIGAAKYAKISFGTKTFLEVKVSFQCFDYYENLPLKEKGG